MIEETTLAKWQLDDAFRLRKLINDHIQKNGLTQATFMERCGYSQGMFGQVCGSDKKPPRRPLSYEQVSRFAKELGIMIENISPTLAREILDMCRHIRLETKKKVSG